MVTAARPHQQTDEKPALTEGLNALDQDRAASVADEGGASAATVEFQRAGKRGGSASAQDVRTAHTRPTGGSK